MASGTIYLPKSSSSGRYIEGKVTWTSSADNDANTSNITAKLYIRKGHHDMTLTEATTGTWNCTLQIKEYGTGGSTLAAKTVNSSLSVLTSWVHVCTVTKNGIAHTSSGNKMLNIYASVTAPTGTSFAGEVTKITEAIHLDVIPRATTVQSLVCSTSYLDGTMTVKYTPQSSSFYNKRIVYLNDNGTLTNIGSANLGQKSATSQTSTINLSDAELSKIYAKVPNSTSVKIRVSFLTYSSSAYTVQIGRTQYKEITLTIPLSVKPTASLSVTRVNTNSWIESKGIYVAGYSQVKLTLSAAAGEGASLTSTTISGNNFSEAATSVTASFSSSGNFTFIGKAVDSRGRSADSSKSITVYTYLSPTIHSLKIERGTYASGWTPSDNGPDVRVIFNIKLGLVDFGNTYNATFKIDGTTETPGVGTTSGLASGANQTVYFKNLDGERTHNLILTVTDAVGSVVNTAISIPTVNITIEFNDSGKGIAFGKTSEKDAFECAMDAEFSGGVDVRGNITKDGTPFVSLNDMTHAAILSSMSVEEASVVYLGRVPILVQLKITFSADVPKYTGLFSENGLITNLPANRTIKDSTNTYELQLRNTLIQTLSAIPAGTYTFYCLCIPA